MMRRTAIYCRVSSQDQSNEIQRADLDEYARKRGWSVVGVFEDKASGTSSEKRPELHKLLTLARERKVDVILIWKLDRFFRSLKDLVVTLAELDALGVEFVSLKDNIDLSTPTGRLLMQLLGSVAEFEASLIRARVRAGLDNAKRKGKTLGRPSTINKAIVLQLREAGMSLSEIAKEVGCSKSAVSKTLSRMRLNKSLNNIENTEPGKDQEKVE